MIDLIAPLAAGPSFAEIDARITRMIGAMGHPAAMSFLRDHAAELKQAEIYEPFLIDTFLSCPWNWSDVPLPVLRKLFLAADRQRLRSWSAPLPGPGPYVLFRGVAGVGEARRPRGLSWTADRERAVWFAERLGLRNPAVVKAILPARSVFFYTTRRNEAEFVCDVPKIIPVTTVWRGEPDHRVRSLADMLRSQK